MRSPYRRFQYTQVAAQRGPTVAGMQAPQEVLAGDALWNVVANASRHYENAVAGATEVDADAALRALELGRQTGDELLQGIGEAYFRIIGQQVLNYLPEAA